MIIIRCNACKAVLDPGDGDAVLDGRTGPAAERADVCGPCMRDAADRVRNRLTEARLRAAVQRADAVPQTVQERARSISLPRYLTRSRD